MKKFEFRLEKVLEMKERELQREQKALADLLRKQQEAHELLNEKRIMVEGYIQKMEKVASGEAGTLKTYYEYLQALLQEMYHLQNRIIDLEKQADVQRKKLLDVQKEQKILENLKEQNYQKYLEENKKNEQSFLDEIAMLGAQPE
ncbi:MAG: flagellar export protein FliJ [Calditrichaeota bacterium]|nr:flagellar export protein FliJ [Calditrichota bacterium]